MFTIIWHQRQLLQDASVIGCWGQHGMGQNTSDLWAPGKKKGICQKQPATRKHRTSPGAVSMPLRGSATSNPRSDPAPEQGQAAAAHLRQGCSDVS